MRKFSNFIGKAKTDITRIYGLRKNGADLQILRSRLERDTYVKIAACKTKTEIYDAN